MDCHICGSSDLDRLRTLKRDWLWCAECGSVVARLRRAGILRRGPLAWGLRFLNRILGNRLRFLERDFLISPIFAEDGAALYSKYADFLAGTGGSLDPWVSEVDAQIERLREWGIDYRGKRVLIISGGPGMLAHRLSEEAEVVVTEFSLEVTRMMQEHLGLKVACYDLNGAPLESVVDGTFDLVIADSCINFCEDQSRFVESVSRLVNPGAHLVINNDVPSLAFMLTWQFEDYIPTHFANNQAFRALFYSAAPWQLVGEGRNQYNAYWYRLGTGGWKNKIAYCFRTPVWAFYAISAFLPWKTFNRKWWSLTIYSVFRMRPEVSPARRTVLD